MISETEAFVFLLTGALPRFFTTGTTSEAAEDEVALLARVRRFIAVGAILDKVEALVTLLAGALARFRAVGIISEEVEASVALVAAAFPRFFTVGTFSEKVVDEAALLARVSRVAGMTTDTVEVSVALLARVLPLLVFCAGRTTSEKADAPTVSLSYALVLPRFCAGTTSEKVDGSRLSLPRFFPRVPVLLVTEDMDDVELRVDARLAFVMALPFFAGARFVGAR